MSSSCCRARVRLFGVRFGSQKLSKYLLLKRQFSVIAISAPLGRSRLICCCRRRWPDDGAEDRSWAAAAENSGKNEYRGIRIKPNEAEVKRLYSLELALFRRRGDDYDWRAALATLIAPALGNYSPIVRESAIMRWRMHLCFT